MRCSPLLIGALAVLLGVSTPRVGAATEPRHGADLDAPGRVTTDVVRVTSASPLDVAPGSTRVSLAVPRVQFQRAVALYRPGVDEPAFTPAAPPAPPLERTALGTSLAATGALTGATVTFGLLTRRANAALRDRLGRFPAPRASVEDSRARVRTFALLTDGFGVAAATALGVSTYFYFSTGKLSDDAGSSTGLRAQIGPRASSVTWVADF